MYEHMTYEFILERMLARAPDNIDKREGSIIYDACAPAAAELAQMYIELDINYNLSFSDTATGDYLTRKAEEFGVNRSTATAAVRRGLFYSDSNAPLDVPLGSRYSLNDLIYVVSGRISTGTYRLTCERTGTVGNVQFGTLLPIDYVANLARAELGEVLVPGEDEEADDSLRRRLLDHVNEPAFGGNVADYKNKINSIPGVGATKVYPAWDGGGTVKCTIIASDWSIPSSALVDEAQTIIDPTINSGQGIGVAPIGHRVTIEGVSGKWVWVTVIVVLDEGATVSLVQEPIQSAIEEYYLELRKDWHNQSALVLRVAQVSARLLSIPGVNDIVNISFDDAEGNVSLDANEIPILAGVGVYE